MEQVQKVKDQKQVVEWAIAMAMPKLICRHTQVEARADVQAVVRDDRY
jgi:hypothetical protein